MTLNWPPVWLSLRVAGIATAGALAVGLWLGHRVATREFTGRKATLGLLALLFAMPVVILAWVLLRPAFPWQAGAAVGSDCGTAAGGVRVAESLAGVGPGIRQCGAQPGLL